MEKESIEKQLSMPENASDFTLLSELTSKLEEIDIELMEAMEDWEMTQNELEEKEKL